MAQKKKGNNSKLRVKKCKRHKYEGGKVCLKCGNKKHSGSGVGAGAPKLYTSTTVMQRDIEKYFKACDDYSYKATMYQGVQVGYKDVTVKKPKPYTVEGLANALGMSRKSLAHYEKDQLFGNTVKNAKRMILVQKMERGNMGEGSPDFIKFDLKNNYDYVDRMHNDNTNRNGEPADPFDVEALEV